MESRLTQLHYKSLPAPEHSIRLLLSPTPIIRFKIYIHHDSFFEYNLVGTADLGCPF